MNFVGLLFGLLTWIVKSEYNQDICIHGDLSKNWTSELTDPRPLWGTYSQVTVPNYATTMFKEDSTVFIHRNFHYSSFYIAQHVSGSWLILKTPPNATTGVEIFAQCLKNNLLECTYDQWYYQFGSTTEAYKLPGQTVKNTECQKNFCITSGSAYVMDTDWDFTGDMTYMNVWNHSNYGGRYYFQSETNAQLAWWFQNSTTASSSDVWVYGLYASAFIACAHGYVESPVFCSQFVYAAEVMTTPFEYHLGTCGPTEPPTSSPTPAPSIAPTQPPTAAPTYTPRCSKQYIFKAEDEYTVVEMDCPFGYTGEHVVWNCTAGGEWVTVQDDCRLISMADDFSYLNEEMWSTEDNSEWKFLDTNDGSYYMYDESSEDSLTTFALFSPPIRVRLEGVLNSSACVGYQVSLVSDTGTTDAFVQMDCVNVDISVGSASTLTDAISGAAFSSNELSVSAFFLFDYDMDGYLSIIYSDSITDENHFLTSTITSGTQYHVKIADTKGTTRRRLDAQGYNSSSPYYFLLESFKISSFVDRFHTTAFSSIWSEASSNYSHSAAFLSLFPQVAGNESTQALILPYSNSIASDATYFQFNAPFVVRLVYFTNAADRSLSVSLTANSTTDTAFSFTDDGESNVAISLSNSAAATSSRTANLSNCLTSVSQEIAVYLTIDRTNITAQFIDSSTICAELYLGDSLTRSHLDDIYEYEWLSISVGASRATTSVELNYIDVTSDAQPEFVTDPPTSAPTPEPTQTTTTSLCPEDNDFNISLPGQFVTAECGFGEQGTENQRYCYPNGTWGPILYGCYPVSFSDQFVNGNADGWMIVGGDGSLSDIWDDETLQITPSNDSISVISTAFEVDFPIRIRVMVSHVADNTANECNAFLIAVGESYAVKGEESTRLQWDCSDGKFGFYNHSTGGKTEGACFQPDTYGSQEIILTLTRNGAAYQTSVDCGQYAYAVNDIVQSGSWDAYIFLGTFVNSGLEYSGTVMARFDSIFYTQFFSDFDGQRTDLWQVSQTESGGRAYLWDNSALTGNDNFQFNLPFKVDMTLSIPAAAIVVGATTQAEETSIFAHVVMFGTSVYTAESTAGVVTIIWDERDQTRTIYTGAGMWVTGETDEDEDGDADCDFAHGTVSTDYDVSIMFDDGALMIRDSICNNVSLYVPHDLDTQVSDFVMTMVSGRTGAVVYGPIEVYQLSGNFSEAWSLETYSTETPVDDEEGDEPSGSDGLIAGLPDLVVYIIFVVGCILLAVVLCWCCYYKNICCKKKEKESVIGGPMVVHGHAHVASMSPRGMGSPVSHNMATDAVHPYSAVNVHVASPPANQDIQMVMEELNQMKSVIADIHNGPGSSKNIMPPPPETGDTFGTDLMPGVEGGAGGGEGEGVLMEGDNVGPIPVHHIEEEDPDGNPQLANVGPGDGDGMPPMFGSTAGIEESSSSSEDGQDIMVEFFEKTNPKGIYEMLPVDSNGQRRLDLTRARIILAKFRQMPPGSVTKDDPGLEFLIGKTIDGLRHLTCECPSFIVSQLYGNRHMRSETLAQDVNFLNEFLEKVNLKQLFGKLRADTGSPDPRLDIRHARIVIANLREVSFGMVGESDPGVALMLNKNMTELRDMLSSVSMADLKLLDLEAFHRYAASVKANMNIGPPAGLGSALSISVASERSFAAGGSQRSVQSNVSLAAAAAPASPKPFQLPKIQVVCQKEQLLYHPDKFACFSELEQFIKRAFPNLGDGFEVTYMSANGDAVTVQSDMHIQTLLKHTIDSGASLVRVDVYQS